MFFRLCFIQRRLFFNIFGVVAQNGKIYFSTLDLAHVMGQLNLVHWSQTVASCRLKDIMPDCDSFRQYEWLIEHHALLQLIMIRISTKPQHEAELNLWDLLERRHVRVVTSPIERNAVTQMEECIMHEGKPFRAWITDFRHQVLQTPSWMIQLGLSP